MCVVLLLWLWTTVCLKHIHIHPFTHCMHNYKALNWFCLVIYFIYVLWFFFTSAHLRDVARGSPSTSICVPTSVFTQETDHMSAPLTIAVNALPSLPISNHTCSHMPSRPKALRLAQWYWCVWNLSYFKVVVNMRYRSLGNFHVKNNLRKTFFGLINFCSFVWSVKFF